MRVVETGLVARAKGVSTHLLSRSALEALAEADDLTAFARSLSRLGAQVESVGEPVDVFAVERAVGRTAHRHLRTLNRWRERLPGVLDVFAARQDRRSLRALLRGAAEGAPSRVRLEGLFATPTLLQPALSQLAHQPSPADVVRQLVQLGHPDARRLLPVVQASQIDLLAVDVVLLAGLAERATQAAIGADETTRNFVRAVIDVGNAQNALLFAGGPRDIDPANLFVHGGRWLSRKAFAAAAAATSQERALILLAAALAASPLASSLPAVPADVVHLERAFLTQTLKQLTWAARLDPLSEAPLLRVLLLIEAQSRDLRTLAWGAVLGTPPLLRKQHLVTPT